MEKKNEEKLPEITDTTRVYLKAFSQAINELEEVKKEEKRLFIRKAQLNETIKALGPLLGTPTQDVNELSFSNAVRLVFHNLGLGRGLSAIDVRTKLDELGYNLKQFDNPLANIHTAINRMLEGDELVPMEDEGKKKKFEPGPELKSLPEEQPINLEKVLTESEGKT